MIEYNGNIYWASRDYLGRLTSDTLAEDLDDSEAEIDLTDSTKYGSSGSIICGSEVITFSGNVANTLSGCGRGAYGSTAATHTSGATIYGFNNGYKSLTTDTNWHPMCIFGDYLAIGSGRYIEHLSSAGTLTSTAVDLPLGYKIKSLAVYGNKLYIGTWKGSNIYEQPEAKLFSCTMTQMLSGTFEEVTSIKECGINAMIVWKNNLIVFAGIAGNIYAYNGATLTKIKTIPRIESNTGDWAYVEPGAVIEYQGNLLFGVSSTSADYAGIYMFDKDSLALTSSHILSTGDFTDVEINSLCNIGTNQFYVSYLDGTSGAFSIDAISTTKRITSTAFWESQIYDIEVEDGFAEINGFELIMKPLATGNSVAVKYKKDNASSWSTWGTITSTNQVAPLWVAIGLAKTLQIRLEFTTNTSSNDSPSILAIKIY
jgi:hypothetical protein